MAESPIRVIARAVTILDCFLDARGTLGVTEISRQTGLSKSTVHHFVTTLVETGLLAVDEPTRRYRLGPKLAQLGNAFNQSTELLEMAVPALNELRDLTGETAALLVKVGDQRVTMAQAVSNQSIRRVLEIGASRPVYLGAVGIVMMGDLSDADVLRLVKRSRPRSLTPKTVTDPQEINKHVIQARADGYAILGEQTEEGVGVIALPIHDQRGMVPAAIIVTGPINRWNPATIAPHVEAMKAIVSTISRHLGQRSPQLTASAAS